MPLNKQLGQLLQTSRLHFFLQLFRWQSGVVELSERVLETPSEELVLGVERGSCCFGEKLEFEDQVDWREELEYLLQHVGHFKDLLECLALFFNNFHLAS